MQNVVLDQALDQAKALEATLEAIRRSNVLPMYPPPSDDDGDDEKQQQQKKQQRQDQQQLERAMARAQSWRGGKMLPWGPDADVVVKGAQREEEGMHVNFYTRPAAWDELQGPAMAPLALGTHALPPPSLILPQGNKKWQPKYRGNRNKPPPSRRTEALLGASGRQTRAL